MKLECRGYGGPYLPKDTSYRPVEIDSRIRSDFIKSISSCFQGYFIYLSKRSLSISFKKMLLFKIRTFKRFLLACMEGYRACNAEIKS